MPEETKTTNEKRLDALARRERPTRNKLGMEDDEYEKYKRSLINKYRDGFGLSIRGIAQEEQDKGISLYPDRLRRWIHNSEVRVKTKEETLRKHERGGEQKTIYLNQDQIDILNQFPNLSEVVRMGVDIVCGLPTENVVLYLGDQKNVIFMFDGKEVQAYITSDLTTFEEKTVQTLINKAKLHGSHYIINFAIENDLTYYGGDITTKK